MDSRKCQTATATPAEPGDLPLWFRLRDFSTDTVSVTLLLPTNVSPYASASFRRRPASVVSVSLISAGTSRWIATRGVPSKRAAGLNLAEAMIQDVVRQKL